MITKLDIKPPRPATSPSARCPAATSRRCCSASGWRASPKLLVLHEPTQAVDVGARHDIIDAIREAAADGCGVLISSVDAADLAVLCDRVLVFRDGAVIAELTGELTQDDIIHATFGSPREEPREEPDWKKRGGPLMDTARQEQRDVPDGRAAGSSAGRQAGGRAARRQALRVAVRDHRRLGGDDRGLLAHRAGIFFTHARDLPDDLRLAAAAGLHDHGAAVHDRRRRVRRPVGAGGLRLRGDDPARCSWSTTAGTCGRRRSWPSSAASRSARSTASSWSKLGRQHHRGDAGHVHAARGPLAVDVRPEHDQRPAAQRLPEDRTCSTSAACRSPSTTAWSSSSASLTCSRSRRSAGTCASSAPAARSAGCPASGSNRIRFGSFVFAGLLSGVGAVIAVATIGGYNATTSDTLPAAGLRRGLPRHRDLRAGPVQPARHLDRHLLPGDRHPRPPAARPAAAGSPRSSTAASSWSR